MSGLILILIPTWLACDLFYARFWWTHLRGICQSGQDPPIFRHRFGYILVFVSRSIVVLYLKYHYERIWGLIYEFLSIATLITHPLIFLLANHWWIPIEHLFLQRPGVFAFIFSVFISIRQEMSYIENERLQSLRDNPSSPAQGQKVKKVRKSKNRWKSETYPEEIRIKDNPYFRRFIS